MKKLWIFALAAIMVMGLAISAQAVPTIEDPSNGEMHLYQIVADPAFGSLTGFASSQAFADAFPTVETLPENIPLHVNAFAKFASFTQDPGAYNSAGSNFFSHLTNDFPLTANGIFTNLSEITVFSFIPFGFVDGLNRSAPDTYDYMIYTEPAMNQGSLENGVIFQISPTHWIVAFEDGEKAGSLGDQDYNDLVLNVTTVPVLPSALLLGSGLLGLVGWRRFRKG